MAFTSAAACVTAISVPPIRPLTIAPPLGCATGCAIYAPTLVGTVPFLPTPSGTLALNLPIPPDPLIVGFVLVIQNACVVTLPNARSCVVLSNGVEIRISIGPCF